MTELRLEYDAFLVPSAEARMLDRWCDEIESALRRGQPPNFREWLERLPVSLQPLAIKHLLEIDRSVAVDNHRECRTLAEYERALPEFVAALHQVWPEFFTSVRGQSSQEMAPSLRWPERFRVIRKIGEGGLGEVHLAEHRLLGRLVAAKVLRRRFAQLDIAVERFRQEIKTLAALNHPGIAAAVDADIIDGHPVLIVEFVDGHTLQELVHLNGPLPWSTAASYCCELAAILDYTHARKVIHRDVKPSNVMLSNEGRIRLLDLGLARFSDSSMESETGEQQPAFSGTPDFAAPEQQKNASPDPRSDIYALGSTFYFLVQGSVMYPSATIDEKLRQHREGPVPTFQGLKNEVPDAVTILFQKMVAKDPADRYQTMADVEESLRQCLALKNSGIRPVKTTRRRWIVSTGITALAALAAATTINENKKVIAPHRFKNSIGLEFTSLGMSSQASKIVGQRSLVFPTRFWSNGLVPQSLFCQIMDLTVGKSPMAPMTGVDWREANAFCDRLNALPEEQLRGRRYRLPREAVWDELTSVLVGDVAPVKLQMSSSNTANAERRKWLKDLSDRGIWTWCSDSLLAKTGPRSINNIPAGSRIGQFPLRGGSGLFIRNFDLFMMPDEDRIQLENVQIVEESDHRTRYYAPTKRGVEGHVIYHYQLQASIQSAHVFGSVLAHQPDSTVRLEVSTDGSRWHVIDQGYVVDGARKSRDVTRQLTGSKQVFVRFSLQQDSAQLFYAQALRTSPDEQMQFPHVYQFQAETEHAAADYDARMVAPASLRHPRVGIRVICEVS